MINNQIIENAKKYVFDFFLNDSSGHDYWHTIRVYNNAKMIAKNEEADLFVIELAALLHDVDDEKLISASDNNALKFLKSQNLEDETIQKIIYIIENQSFKKTIGNNKKLKTIEAMVVQDADRLDSMGAIGIARTFAYGGYKGKEIHNPNKQINEYKNQDEYVKNSNTSINHFYEKLLKIKDLMNTRTAKKIAVHRHQFIEYFLEEFYGEWDGKK